MNKNILIIAAHPDDEVLGCGGAIAKHVNEGDVVSILFMTNGVSSRGLATEGAINERKVASINAAAVLKIKSTQCFNFPDNKMDTLSLLDIVRPIEKVIANFKPEIIYTHHYGDLNIDHQVTHKSVVTACRPQPNSLVKEIYTFEILSSTEWQTPGMNSFSPNVFVDITNFIDVKKQAILAYSEEMRESPHSRSIENIIRLNALRGNSVGVKFAEAFNLLRMIK